MQGGGEEYFAPPEEIDPDTTARFATLCARLRKLEKAGRKVLTELAEMADGVGTSMTCKEMVAGAIMRCIMSSGGARQLSYWYLLDKLAKDLPDTFGYIFSLHILDVASDAMPWDDPALFPKLESLVEHWDGVFPRDTVDRIYLSRKERQWAAKNPLEAAQMRAEEEKKWAEVEKAYTEEDGLDLYEQPCLAFMQGRCPWGEQCTQFHPDGLEGTLPPETRLGDWRCPGCGAINRHFRRRCFSCPREKPQYRKDASVRTKEEVLLSAPDADALAALRQRWGYNTSDEEEAAEYWRRRFEHEPPTAFVEARRNAYLSSIIPAVRHALAAAAAAAASAPPGTRRSRDDESGSAAVPQKAHRAEGGGAAAASTAAAAAAAGPVKVKLPEVPAGPAPDRVMHICQRVIERGAHDADFAGYLYLLCRALPDAVKDVKWSSSRAAEDSLALVECSKRVFAAWSTWRAAREAAGGAAAGGATRMHPATPYFSDLRKYLAALPLAANHREEISRMCDAVSRA